MKQTLVKQLHGLRDAGAIIQTFNASIKGRGARRPAYAYGTASERHLAPKYRVVFFFSFRASYVRWKRVL